VSRDSKSSQRIDFDAINRAALQNLPTLLGQWLPGGRTDGAEWKALNPTRADSRIGSFTINAATGVWRDFATQDGGSDPISLYAYLFTGNEMGKAARELAAECGIDLKAESSAGAAPAAQREKTAARRPTASRTPWTPLPLVPEDAPPPPKAHPKRGRPETVHTYRSAGGAVLGYVCRFCTSGGGKETLPLVFARNSETGGMAWRWMAFAAPRPLQGLNDLAEKLAAPVLFVEGEKCVDTAASELPDFVLMTLPGGCKADGKVNYTPLAGRRVILWPDADAKRESLTAAEKRQDLDPNNKPLLASEKQPGAALMHRIARRLLDLGCDVSMMDIGTPGEKPDGWDVADEIAAGRQGAALSQYIQERARPYKANVSPHDDTPAADADNQPPWLRGLIRTSRGRPEDCRENVYLILSRHPDWFGVIGHNEFSARTEKRKPPPTGGDRGELTSEDVRNIGLWLAQRCDLLIKAEGTLSSGIEMVAAKNRFHEVREFLESLPPWDGVDRCDYFLTDCLRCDDATYTRLVSRYFLIGMVARVLSPGCRMQYMLILEGPQGVGKSTALRILADPWFADTPFKIGDKDAYQVITNAWLYEMAEMDSLNRSETTAVKAFVSSEIDRFREPYERRPIDRPRQVVFAGTTNSGEYFKDTTGNRRFWPVRVGRNLDLKRLAEWRPQLFAESLYRFRQGERWHPTREEDREFFQPVQEQREIVDPWLYPLEAWLDDPLQRAVNAFTSYELLVGALNVSTEKVDGNRSMATRVGNLMAKIGWRKARRSTGRRDWIYLRPAQAQLSAQSETGGEECDG